MCAKGVTEDGSSFVTRLLAEVLVLHAEREHRERVAVETAEHMAALGSHHPATCVRLLSLCLAEEHFVRTEPLGRDRSRREYWCFRGSASRLWVQSETATPTRGGAPSADSGEAMGLFASHKPAGTIEEFRRLICISYRNRVFTCFCCCLQTGLAIGSATRGCATCGRCWTV